MTFRALIATLLLTLLFGDARLVEAAPSTAARRPAAPRTSRAGRGLRLRARYRLARIKLRRAIKRQASRSIAKSKAGRFVVRAGRRVVDSPFGRWVSRRWRGIGRGAGKVYLGVTARITLGADWLERRLPAVWRSSYSKLRAIDPLALGEFLLQRIKSDPVFFATYGSWSMAFSSLIVPTLVGIGVDPITATVLRFATATPMDLLAVSLRVHSRREDRSQTFGDTARGLRKAYHDFAEQRRERNRAHLRSKQLRAQPGTLRRLGAEL